MSTEQIDVRLSESNEKFAPLASEEIVGEDENDEQENNTDSDGSASTLMSSSVLSQSILQSTPRVGPPPSPPPTHLPSAIKAQPTPSRTSKSQRKGILSVLSSIAEKSLSSPLKRIQRQSIEESLDEDIPLNNNDDKKNNNNISKIIKCAAGDDNREKRSGSQCTCQDCKAALMRDTFSDEQSEVSCSMLSIASTPHRVRHSFAFGKDKTTEENCRQSKIGYPDMQEQTRYAARFSDHLQNFNRILHTTLAAGRRSIGQHIVSPKSGKDDSELNETPNASRNRWKYPRKIVTGGTSPSQCVPELLSKQVKSPSRTPSMSSTTSQSTFKGSTVRGSEISTDASLDSIMVVLLPPETHGTDMDYIVRNFHENSRIVVRDPLLKELLEELKREMMNQEVIVKQASKALDECGNLMHKATEGIICAEQILHIASESYFTAEHELHRLIDGGEFEPQNDRVVLRKMTLRLSRDFVGNVESSKKQFIFLVLFKWDHKVESSQIIYLQPEDETLVVNKSHVFTFNRPNWRVNIEVYSVFMKRSRDSLRNLSRMVRRMDIRNTSHITRSPSREVEVRKSSFGLLARACLSKGDILANRKIELINCVEASPLQKTIVFDGEVHLNQMVYFESYLGVKDYNGVFGWQGRMKTFNAKLFNTRLELFEVSDCNNDQAVSLHSIDISNLKPEAIFLEEFQSSYFHDFTLRLGSPENWVHLCTNSRDDTAQWIENLKRATKDPTMIRL